MISDTFRYYEERCAKEGGMKDPPGAYRWGEWATEVVALERRNEMGEVIEFKIADAPIELVRVDPDGKIHIYNHVYENWEELAELINKLLDYARTLEEE